MADVWPDIQFSESLSAEHIWCATKSRGFSWRHKEPLDENPKGEVRAERSRWLTAILMDKEQQETAVNFLTGQVAIAVQVLRLPTELVRSVLQQLVNHDLFWDNLEMVIAAVVPVSQATANHVMDEVSGKQGKPS